MEFQSVMEGRYSCRAFLDKPIEPEKLETILHNAQYGPTGMNRRPFRFVLATSEEALGKIRKALPWGDYHVPAVILVIADTKKSSDFFTADCAAATENILLTATDLGLGSLWTVGYPISQRFPYLAELCSLKEGELVFSVVLLGYASPDAKKKPRQFEEGLITRI